MLVQDPDEGYTLRIPLPLAEQAKIDLWQSADELTLTVGSYRRNVVLPRVLWSLEIEAARLNDDILAVRFKPAEKEG